MRVQTGVSDGTTTAIVDGDLAENAQVVTGVAAAGSGGHADRHVAVDAAGGRRPGRAAATPATGHRRAAPQGAGR